MSNRRKHTRGAQQREKPEKLQHKADTLAPIEDLQSVNLMPADSEERSRSDQQITFRIFLAAQQRLNAKDLPVLKRLYRKTIGTNPQVKESPETWRRLFYALDEAICEHARTIGMRVYLSGLVYARICQWEDSPNGAELHEKLGNALAQNVRISRGEAKAPINAHLKIVRHELISEAKKLQNLLKAKFPQRSLPNKEKILSAALDLIAAPEYQFVQLKTNAQAIRNFDAADAEGETETFPRLFELITGTTSPAVFVNALLAWSTGRDYEALRQALTKL